MKNILKMWPGKAKRKKITSLSVIRMQALKALQICLDVTLKSPVTITQIDIAVGDETKMGETVFVEVMMDAFFFYEGMPKLTGREGLAPTPPKAMVKLRYITEGAYKLWRICGIEGLVEGSHLDYTLEHKGEILHNFTESSPNAKALEAIMAFDKKFNENRPCGVLACVNDYVDWDVSSPWRGPRGINDPY